MVEESEATRRGAFQAGVESEVARVRGGAVMGSHDDVIVDEGTSDADLERFTGLVEVMWGAASGLLNDRGHAAPQLRVVASADIMATSAVEGDRLGLGPDRRTGAPAQSVWGASSQAKPSPLERPRQ